MAESIKGTFGRQVIDAYRAAELDPKDRLSCRLPGSAAPPAREEHEAKMYKGDDVYYSRPAKPGHRRLSSMGSCLYMDVGMWAGDGPANSPQHHPRKRQFGVVSGNVAALCQYPQPPISKGEAKWRRHSAGLPEAFFRRITLLLNALSQSNELGAVEVVNVLSC